MNKKVKIIVLIILLIGLSFFRENFFKNLNEIINQHNYPNSKKIDQYLLFMRDYSSSALINIKWCATLVFSGMFLSFSLVLIPLLFNDKKYNPLIILAYSGIIVLSALAVGTGKAIPSIHFSAYYFARWMIGTTQSPLLTAILSLFIYYQKRNNK